MIYHAGAWNVNWGDRMIQAAMRQHLEAMAGRELDIRYIDVQNEAIPVDEVNERASVLVIGPGGLIMNKEHGVFQARCDDWSAIDIPIVVQSIGWNEFPYRDFIGLVELPNTQEGSLRYSERHDRPYIYGSKWVPDAAFWIKPGEPSSECSDPETTFKVGVCVATDREHQRWPDAETHWGFMCRLGTTLHWLRTQGVEIRWFRHCPQDLHDYDDIIHGYYPGQPPASREAAPRLAADYAEMDLVLGMRKHSVIVPLGLGVPAVALGDQAEVRWFMEDLDEDWALVTSQNMDEMQDIVERALDDNDYPVRVMQKKQLWRDGFNGSIWRILNLAGYVREAVV